MTGLLASNWTTLNWDSYTTLTRFRSGLKQAEAKAEAPRRQELGFVGRLTCDPQYRREQAELKARWEALDPRPSLSGLSLSLLHSPVVPVKSIDRRRGRVSTTREGAFLDAFVAFLRRWELDGFVTWDLPKPQGPLYGVPMRLAMHLLGPDRLVDVIPSHYDLGTSPRVLRELRARQAWAGKEAGVEMKYPVTDTSARGDSASRFETAFHMWLIESTILSRYPSARGRGLVARLLPVFTRLYVRSETSNGSTARAKKIRGLYSNYLN
jgi:hypothetical protein